MKTKKSFYIMFTIFSMGIIGFFAVNMDETYHVITPKHKVKKAERMYTFDSDQVHYLHL